MNEEAFAVIRARSGKIAARLLIGAGAMALLIPAIAGCEAGENAPTIEFHSASAGAHTLFNGITISNVFVLGGASGVTLPPGGSASLFLALYNNNASGDQFVSAAAPGTAKSVSLSAGTVALPAESAVNLTGPHPEVVLNNLTTPLRGGTTIKVTLDFAHAGSVTLQVPVEPQSYYWSTYSAPPSPPTRTPVPTGTPVPTVPATATATPTP